MNLNIQGHCINTITPVGNLGAGPGAGYGAAGYGNGYGNSGYGNGFNNGQGAANYEYGPTGLDPYNQSKDKIISTEGCFSCKVNGISSRGKRSIQSANNSTVNSTFQEAVNTSTPLVMTLKLDQTKHRTNILQLQPAIRDVKVFDCANLM